MSAPAKPAFIHRPCRTCGQSRRVRNGGFLRSLREVAGLSLREVARRLGLSAAYLSDVERNQRHVSEMLWFRYRAALGIR